MEAQAEILGIQGGEIEEGLMLPSVPIEWFRRCIYKGTQRMEIRTEVEMSYSLSLLLPIKAG